MHTKCKQHDDIDFSIGIFQLEFSMVFLQFDSRICFYFHIYFSTFNSCETVAKNKLLQKKIHDKIIQPKTEICTNIYEMYKHDKYEEKL